MYKANDIARLVINSSNDFGIPCSNLKLQKLMFFVQWAFLNKYNEPCFEGEFEAWKFGPVLPDVYHDFKVFGSSSIPTIKTYLQFNNNDFRVERLEYDVSTVNVEHIDLIHRVIRFFGEISALQMVEIIHRIPTWNEVFEPNQNRVISYDEIKRMGDEIRV